MGDDYYMPPEMMMPQGPQRIQEIQNKNPFNQPNADLITTSDILKILQHYTAHPKKDQFLGDGQEMYDYFPGLFNKQSSITFYDIQHKPIFDINLEVAYLDFKMGKPYGHLTQKHISAWSNIKIMGDAIFFRNVGFANGRINERVLESASVNQNITNNVGAGGAMQGGQKKGGISGFISKIF
jgi:hypothetical protein